MAVAKSFKDLIVWQRAHELVLLAYTYSAQFPKEETFGLRSQFRRSAVSVAANIAEGFIKKSPREKIRFLNIAQGSLEETRYYLVLAKDLGYGDNDKLTSVAQEVSKLLYAFMNAIDQNITH
jgi:four helix bundle protein